MSVFTHIGHQDRLANFRKPYGYVLCALLFFGAAARAEVTLPAVISDHMVLQRQSDVVLWGRTDQRKGVTVTTSWNNKKYRAKPDAQGKWNVFVSTPKAGGPFRITFDDGEKRVLEDILIGEVWLCSGQSNMEFKLTRSAGAKEEISRADYPNIRFFNLKRQFGNQPFADTPGSAWVPTTPGLAGSFSAIAYYFARKVHQQTGVPIGIISGSWGGTPAEAWVPPALLQNDPQIAVARQRWQEWVQDSAKDNQAYTAARTPKPAYPESLYMTTRPHREPGVLYNGLIHPIIPYTLRGFLWYQGESNIRWATEYEHLLTQMILGWRNAWNKEQKHKLGLPFYQVQIAPFAYSNMHDASVVRQAQQNIAHHLEHAGLAVTADVGNMEDIHPLRKKEVGERLAFLALAKEYGFKEVVYSGPVYTHSTREGNKIRLHFEQVAGALQTAGGAVTGLEISDASRPAAFKEAQARIEGKTVLVWHDDVPEPHGVRYGWGDQIGKCSLANEAGLPAAPFRSARSDIK